MEQIKIKSTLIDINDENEIIKFYNIKSHNNDLEKLILKTLMDDYMEVYCRDEENKIYYRFYLSDEGKLKLDSFDLDKMSEKERGIFNFLGIDFTDDFDGYIYN